MSEATYRATRATRLLDDLALQADVIEKAEQGDGYRASHLQSINPRSKTEVREGTMPRRALRQLGGATIGTGLGLAAGSLTRRQTGLSLGAQVGNAAGVSVGRTQNLRSGDTRATNRRTGKKAKANVTLPGLGSFWHYS